MQGTNEGHIHELAMGVIVLSVTPAAMLSPILPTVIRLLTCVLSNYYRYHRHREQNGKRRASGRPDYRRKYSSTNCGSGDRRTALAPTETLFTAVMSSTESTQRLDPYQPASLTSRPIRSTLQCRGNGKRMQADYKKNVEQENSD